MRYPLSPNPVWWALQGEGHLRGFQMVFIRGAKCSVGCTGCDTDYSVDSYADEEEIADRALAEVPEGAHAPWCWLTGGEPTDRDLWPLIKALRKRGFSIAVASSGVNRLIPPVDWMSISAHGTELLQRYGNELKLCEGLNGLDLDEWYAANPDDTTDFMYRYVQPLWIGDAATGHECPESLARCLAFLKKHPRWSLSRQDHKHWGVA